MAPIGIHWETQVFKTYARPWGLWIAQHLWEFGLVGAKTLIETPDFRHPCLEILALAS